MFLQVFNSSAGKAVVSHTAGLQEHTHLEQRIVNLTLDLRAYLRFTTGCCALLSTLLGKSRPGTGAVATPKESSKAS